MDALEKERLRRRMAKDIRVFMGGVETLQVVSGHWNDEPQPCELAPEIKSNEIVVVKNRSGKKLRLAVSSLAEMVRFKVVEEAQDLSKWADKIKVLKVESEKRKEEERAKQAEERKKLEKRVIVRKRSSSPA